MNNCTKFAPLILPSLFNLFVTVDIRDESNSLDFLKQFLCTAVHVIISFFLILSYFLFISIPRHAMAPALGMIRNRKRKQMSEKKAKKR